MKSRSVLLILVLLYAVGLAGLHFTETRATILLLTPYMLLLSGIVSFVLYKGFSFRIFAMFLAISTAGFFVEALGVEKGWVFGSYSYKSHLGPGWLSVPFIIGLNWGWLIFFTAQIRIPGVKGIALHSVFSALLMTAFDFIMEPAAVKMDFWQWHSPAIPIQNYLAWFTLSLLFHLAWNSIISKTTPGAGRFIFLIQALFFLLVVWVY